MSKGSRTSSHDSDYSGEQDNGETKAKKVEKNYQDEIF